MSNERVAFKAMFRKTTDVREILERNSFINAITEQMWRGFQAGAEWQRTQAQPADALVEALELLYRKLKPNVNGADETYFFIGLRDQVTERQMEQISEALAAYRAAQEKPHD